MLKKSLEADPDQEFEEKVLKFKMNPPSIIDENKNKKSNLRR